MSAPEPVLCPIDFSPLSQRSLQLAVEMCRRTGAPLVLEHNLESGPPSYLGVGWMWSGEHESGERDKATQAVERLQQIFEQIPDEIEYEAKITRGASDEGILHLAREMPARLIVMGTHGPSSAGHHSLTERLIIRAPCPVLTTGEGYQPEVLFSQVESLDPEKLTFLVPVDFTSRSETSAKLAMKMLRRMPHEMTLLHVLGEQKSRGRANADSEQVEQRLRDLVPHDLTGRVTIRVISGNASATILEVAREIEALFIMMPAHGKSLVRRSLFGTNTLEVLHGSDCPVWFVPPAVTRAAAWTGS